jgi:hypothetical protein
MPTVELTTSEKELLAKAHREDQDGLRGIFTVSTVMHDYVTVIHILDNYIDIFPETDHVVLRELRDAAVKCRDEEVEIIAEAQATVH